MPGPIRSPVIRTDRQHARECAIDESAIVQCPYCWQPNEIEVDVHGGRVQQYVEDCQVCCQPWQVTVDLRGDEPVVTVNPL